jgi:hypothetical protein
VAAKAMASPILLGCLYIAGRVEIRGIQQGQYPKRRNFVGAKQKDDNIALHWECCKTSIKLPCSCIRNRGWRDNYYCYIATIEACQSRGVGWLKKWVAAGVEHD